MKPEKVSISPNHEIKDFLRSANQIVGQGIPEGIFQNIARGIVPLNKLCALEKVLTGERKEKMDAFCHLIRIALRPSKSIFDSHLESYGASKDDMSIIQKNWYEEQIKNWEENEIKVKELLKNPYPALKKWMGKLNLTPEKLEKPKFNPFENDKNKCVPPDLLVLMDSISLFKLKAKEKYGGLGFSQMEYVQALGELAKIDLSLFILASVEGTIAFVPVAVFGTEEQMKEYLCKMSAFALTEPYSGSDAISSMKSEAVMVENGEYFELYGEKLFITNTQRSSVLFVPAKVNGRPTVFIVGLNPAFSIEDTKEEMDEKRKELLKKGIRISKPLKMDAIPGTYQAHITLEGIKVHKKDILGKIGGAAEIVFGSLDAGRSALACGATGTAIDLFNRTRFHAENRRLNLFKMFNKEQGRLIDHPFIQVKHISPMAYMVTGTEATSNMTAAYVEAYGDKENVRAECAKTKSLATGMLENVAQHAHRLHGGSAYMIGHLNGINLIKKNAEVSTQGEGQNDLMDAFSTGVAVQGIKNDGETIAKHAGYFLKKIKDEIGLFFRKRSPEKEVKDKKEAFKPEIRGKLVPAIRRIINGFFHFEKGDLNFKDALWLELKAKTLALKIMLFGLKYGEKFVKMPLEQARISNITGGIYSLVAAHDELIKEKDTMPEAKKISLLRFVEVTKKEIKKNLKELRLNNKEDKKDMKVAKAWIEEDMKNQDLQNTGIENPNPENYQINSQYSPYFKRDERPVQKA